MDSAAALIAARYRSPIREALDALRGGYHATRFPGRALDAARSGAGNLASVRSAADIGARVRDARLEMGMTQQRFADLAGVGRRFLVELEQGKPTLEIDRVLAVCRAAGLTLVFAP